MRLSAFCAGHADSQPTKVVEQPSDVFLLVLTVVLDLFYLFRKRSTLAHVLSHFTPREGSKLRQGLLPLSQFVSYSVASSIVISCGTGAAKNEQKTHSYAIVCSRLPIVF